jgi:hypothetical protein
MNYQWMAKNRGEQLHIRIDDTVKTDLKIIADYNGQTMSGMVYQLILQAIRRAKAEEPQAFALNELREETAPLRDSKGKVVSHPRSLDLARDMVKRDAETLAETTGTLSRLNKKKLDLNAEERAERNDSNVSQPRKRAGRR